MDKRIAVCVSGGLDSFLAYRCACARYGKDNVASVFIDYGQPYLTKEVRAVTQLIPDVTCVHAELAVPALFNVPTVEHQEVFGRNILLAFYGAQLAPEVWLSALETEMNVTAVRDKQPEFLHMLSALFTYTFVTKRAETVVTTPFRHHTKSDIVELALDENWASQQEILSTVSCYDGAHQNCGACSTCFKRWLAMVNNGIHEDYVLSPLLNHYGRTVCRLMAEEEATGKRSGRFSAARVQETKAALAKVGYSLESFGNA